MEDLPLPVVLYTDPAFVDETELELERTALAGVAEVHCARKCDGHFVHDEEFRGKLNRASVVVVSRTQVNRAFVETLGPKCCLVVRQGVGLDNIDEAALASHAIGLWHVPDYCVDEVCSHTLALFLAFERGVLAQHDAALTNRWSPIAGRLPRRVGDLTAGIVGFGRIGRAMAARLRAFVAHIRAYDPWVSVDTMKAYGASRDEALLKFLSACDVVLLHASLNETSRHMINRESLRAAKRGLVLINAARGGLVCVDDVADALDEGRIAGYCTDVFSPEDPNDDSSGRRLLSNPAALITCHRAYLSSESLRSLRMRVVERILQTLRTPRG